jgi:hypothetical protein
MIRIKDDNHLKGVPLVDFLKDQFSAHKNDELSVDLSYHRLFPMKDVAAAIQNRKVKELDLSFASIGDDGVKDLSETLKTHHYIEKINLSHNCISNSGASSLAHAMKLNPRFQIDLRFNKIGPEGGEAIVRSSVHNPQINEIDLTDNSLGDAGAKRIANALKSCSGNVSKLILQHNDIGIEGDKALAENVPSGIRIFHRIRQLNFKEYLQKNPALIFLVVLFLPFLFLFSYRKYNVELEGCERKRPNLS